MEYNTSADNETTVINTIISGWLVNIFVTACWVFVALVLGVNAKATKNMETKFKYINRPQSIAITDRASVPKMLLDIARRDMGWLANSLSLLRKGMNAMEARVKHQR